MAVESIEKIWGAILGISMNDGKESMNPLWTCTVVQDQ